VVQIDFYHRWQAEREPLMIAQVDDGVGFLILALLHFEAPQPEALVLF
jgi:hypothetical protein